MPTAAPSPTEDLVEFYRMRAEPLGVAVTRVADSAAAATTIADLAAEVGAVDACASGELTERAPALVAALAKRTIGWRVPGEVSEAIDAPLGVTLARAGVAETASALMAERDLLDRSIGLVTRTCLVVIPTGDLVPDLGAAAAIMRSVALRPGGGFCTLVTGPSRTADIEMSLTVGVQGPARLLVLFVDELS